MCGFVVFDLLCCVVAFFYVFDICRIEVGLPW